MEWIMRAIAFPLNMLIELCHGITGNYIGAIFLFTLMTRVLLLPLSLWVQKNGIKMVKMMPELNRIKINYYGDKDTIAEETQALYKQEKYHPLASTIPMIVQLVLLIGVINAVKAILGDVDTVLTVVPSEVGGATLLMPVAAGLAALALGLAQNKLNPLQREQGKAEQWMTNGISVAISLLLGAFVPLGVGMYWIASNLFSILQQAILNQIIKPQKYIDYAELEASKKELASINQLSVGVSKEDKKREKADYKRFFSVANKHLVFYSEKSGFYKYFRNIIEYLIQKSNVVIHYVTSDPDDQIFELAKKEKQIRAYYIGEKKLITLMMKMDADIVVMTMPDLDKYHLKRSYVRKDIEYIYMFHGVITGMRTLRPGALDHYDTVLTTGAYIEKEIRLLEGLNQTKKKRLVPCGYGVIEQMAEAYAKMDKTSNERPYVLIAPSWQEDNILESCLVPLCKSIIDKGYDVVVRPHPQYLKRFPHKFEQIQASCRQLPQEHMRFETDFSSNETVFCADLLITDWSSIGYEYTLSTTKPVLFIDTPMKVVNEQCIEIEKTNPPFDMQMRKCVGCSLKPEEAGEKGGSAVQMLLDNLAQYQQTIEKVRGENIYHFGESGKYGAEYIIASLMERKAKQK